MVKVTFYENQELVKTVTADNGRSILHTAKQKRVALRHKCGGNASCLTCKVYIEDQANVSAPNEKEIRRLGTSNLEKNLRLSCQTKIYGNVEISIPEDPYKARVRKLLEQARNNSH